MVNSVAMILKFAALKNYVIWRRCGWVLVAPSLLQIFAFVSGSQGGSRLCFLSPCTIFHRTTSELLASAATSSKALVSQHWVAGDCAHGCPLPSDSKSTMKPQLLWASAALPRHTDKAALCLADVMVMNVARREMPQNPATAACSGNEKMPRSFGGFGWAKVLCTEWDSEGSREIPTLWCEHWFCSREGIQPLSPIAATMGTWGWLLFLQVLQHIHSPPSWKQANRIPKCHLHPGGGTDWPDQARGDFDGFPS